MKITYNTSKKAKVHDIENVDLFVTVDSKGIFYSYFIIHISAEDNAIFNVDDRELSTSHPDGTTLEEVLDLWGSDEQLVAINDEISIQISF